MYTITIVETICWPHVIVNGVVIPQRHAFALALTEETDYGKEKN